ncbi:MAG: T9SS type A sorting domain-containing protein [Roseivirga sp.]|nr:T9SS type A sorting domain-containing protein [Roseivirga sp.]
MARNSRTENVDIAGNRSATSDGFVITIDFKPPAKPIITGISDDTGSSTIDGITSDRNLLIHGTAETEAMVEVFSPGGLIGSVQADANGDWTLDITGFNLPEMISNTTAEAIDLAGNRSLTSDAFVITIDFTSPGVILAIENNSVEGYLISATFDEDISGLTLGEITVIGGTASSLIQTASNTYSFQVNSLGAVADVIINANVTQDVAGNGNAASNQLTLGFTSDSDVESFHNLQSVKKAEDLRVTIYPNPASLWLTIDLTELSADQVDISFVDMSGKTVFSRNDFEEDELRVNVSAYENGLYLVLISTGESLIKNKIMIRR